MAIRKLESSAGGGVSDAGRGEKMKKGGAESAAQRALRRRDATDFRTSRTCAVGTRASSDGGREGEKGRRDVSERHRCHR